MTDPTDETLAAFEASLTETLTTYAGAEAATYIGGIVMHVVKGLAKEVARLKADNVAMRKDLDAIEGKKQKDEYYSQYPQGYEQEPNWTQLAWDPSIPPKSYTISKEEYEELLWREQVKGAAYHGNRSRFPFNMNTADLRALCSALNTSPGDILAGHYDPSRDSYVTANGMRIDSMVIDSFRRGRR